MGMMPLETFEMLGAGICGAQLRRTFMGRGLFRGQGWIPFEPTAGFVLPSITPTTEYAFRSGSGRCIYCGGRQAILGMEVVIYVGLIIGISVLMAVLMISYRWNPLGWLRGLGSFTTEEKREPTSDH